MASEIQEFYKDQTIFITGGTGLVGKLIIEKLLRACFDLKRIYILVRTKKNKTPEERFNDIFNSPCFNVLKQQRPNFQSKVKLIIGDCAQFNLGISNDDWKLLSNEINCIFHVAANVRFDEPLGLATKTNVLSTQEMLKLAECAASLKIFIHMSTAYSHCPKSHIDECFYDPPIKPNTLVALINDTSDDVLEKITPHLLGKWPNTYCYTKAVAEEVLRQANNKFPIVVLRPSIITSSVNEPTPGWIEQFYGVVGISVGIFLGVIKTTCVSESGICHTVPCDFVANASITSAWHSSQLLDNQTTKIYNFTMPKGCSLSWMEGCLLIKKLSIEYPLLQAITYPNFEPTTNIVYHKIRKFLWHTCMSYFADFILTILGRKRIAVKKYKQLDKGLELTEYFSTRSWTFNTDNVVNLWQRLNDIDKKLFHFDMNTVDGQEWFKTSVIQGRKFLMKEGEETVEPAKRRLYKLMIIHYLFIGVVMLIVYVFVKFIFSLII